MVHSAKMNSFSKDATVASMEDIARKSSRNVTLLPMPNKKIMYPIPEELRMALDGKGTEERFQSSAAKHYTRILQYLRDLKDIKPNHYWFIMKLLIYLEHYQCMIDMNQYTLYKQQLRPSKFNNNDWIIQVPGLAEDRPSVRIRDTVILSEENGDLNVQGHVQFVGKNYVSINMGARVKENVKEHQRFNISFLYPDYCFNCMHFAVDRVIKFNMLSRLYPTAGPTRRRFLQQQVTWTSSYIQENPEQQQAVLQILARSAFPAPYILFGPPGTGKTSTLVEAITQIVKKNPSDRILVCTPSNAAADEIAQRLLRNHIDSHAIHRMYNFSRDGNDIHESLKSCSNFVEEDVVFVPKSILESKQIVVTTLITCHRLIGFKLRENHFSYVIVDEAGQATEPETLIPLTLICNAKGDGQLHGQFVIAGDPKQLGPMVGSIAAQPLLGRSMLERLMNWNLYRKDKNNKFNPSYVTKLIRNYRCHPDILHVPNKLFYDGELKACGGAHTKKAIGWRKLPNPEVPLIFHAVEGQEERDPNSPSVYNSAEVTVIISYVRDLLKSKFHGSEIQQKDIGIVTPYRLQRQKVHEKLRANKWDDITVGTIETFQGQERDIIIISTVRSVIYRHQGNIHIGFLSNPKKFNVALTRAKMLLIVVGNPVILQMDQYWRSFITYCIDKNACSGSKFLLQRSVNNAKIRELMARKHVPVSWWDPEKQYEVEEKEPTTKKTFQLPETSATRRRRLPRTKTTGIIDELSFHDENTVLSKLYDDSDDYENFSDENDYGMGEYFMDSSKLSSALSSSSNKESNNLENSWETASSSMTTDQSDKSSNLIDDPDETPTVSGLAKMLPNLKISQEN